VELLAKVAGFELRADEPRHFGIIPVCITSAVTENMVRPEASPLPLPGLRVVQRPMPPPEELFGYGLLGGYGNDLR
jgi:hypothetical protein